MSDVSGELLVKWFYFFGKVEATFWLEEESLFFGKFLARWLRRKYVKELRGVLK